jgi:3-oxoacyl-[acyl-carrier protein] reductase
MSRVALVTGGAGGIGRSINQRLHDAGFAVVAGDLAVAVDAAGAMPECENVVVMDVADRGSVEAAVKTALELGELTTVVNCAGIVRSIPIEDFDSAAAAALWDVNVAGMARVCTAAVPHLGRGASIINVGSVTGNLGCVPDVALYGASKAGVEAYTRYLGCQLAPRGIRVNAVAPGFIDVPMSPSWEKASGGPQKLVESVPLGRLGTTDEIAQVVEFLASERAGYIVGTTIYADGGVLAR